jgi:hypothetical protein
MLGIANEPFMLSVIMLNVDMLNVVAQDPSVVLKYWTRIEVAASDKHQSFRCRST